MIRVACSVKLHAFQLAEQFDRFDRLDKFYTIYHSRKDPVTAFFNHRKDLERIRLGKIRTFPWLAPLFRLRNVPFRNNNIFDSLVASDLKGNTSYEFFLGWSGMSLQSIMQAKRDGKKTIVERGSSHIKFQFGLLKEEYNRWGHTFRGDERVADQEEREYDLADHVTIPSRFVEKTFLDRGFPPNKLFINNFGSNAFFSPTQPKREKFTILYVGSLSIRKGLPYLFKALTELRLPLDAFDVWFIGNINHEIKEMIPRFVRANWKFFGYVNHYALSDLISQGSIAVHPSIEEGMSMVIPQLMACGTPVIATTNTGGEDIIINGVNGFIVPIRDDRAITNAIMEVFEDRDRLKAMQAEAVLYSRGLGSWDQYGERYVEFINRISRDAVID